jgi:hypothetical protein
MGFPHVLPLARRERMRVLQGGQQEAETVWLITRLSPDPANAPRLLELARQYWSIEHGRHYPLDVSSAEDRCRVRHPVAATVLGIRRRAIQGEYRSWARRQRRPPDRTCPVFKEKISRRINLVMRFLTGGVSRL